jgi:hypothetical protein
MVGGDAESRKPSFGRPDDVRRRRVQDNAFKGIACVVPRRPLQRTSRIRIARLPAQANPRRTEIDILGVVFIIEPRRQKLH